MARPDTDDGWFKLAYELDAALAAADFSQAAQMILVEVRAQVFGRAKRRHATIVAADLARRSGKLRQFFERGLAELVRAGVLARAGDDAYRFIKDYQSWKHPSGTDRLDPTEVAWCAAAPRNALAYRHTSRAKNGNSPVAGCNPLVATDATNELPNCNSVVAKMQPDSCMVEPPAHKDRARPELIEGELEKGGEAGSLRSPAAGAGAGGGGIAVDPHPGPGTDSPEAQALFDWASPLGLEWASWARGRCDRSTGSPAEWIKALLVEKVLGASLRPKPALLNAILRRWHAEGRCDLLAPRSAGPAGDGQAAPPPTSAVARRKATREAVAKLDFKAMEEDITNGRR